MIKRIVEISRSPVHLSTRLDQLVVQPLDEDKAAARTIPCEDIGFVLLDHPQVTVTHPALATLMRFGAAVMVCGKDHLPAGLLLPLSTNTETVWRVQDQINATAPTRKRLWQQIIAAKVRAQAVNLPPASPLHGLLLTLAGDVKSGDPDNIEAQAARFYWSAWLAASEPGCPQPGCLIADTSPAAPTDRRGDTPAPKVYLTEEAQIADTDPALKGFRRDPDGLDPLNAHLNYGYAVIRAAVARAIVSAGLFPALGIHHRNRSNSFALADDLVEPFRPMIDRRVRDLHRRGRTAVGLDQLNKAVLLEALNETMKLDGQEGPLMVVLSRYVASFTRCLRREEEVLAVPVVTNSGV